MIVLLFKLIDICSLKFNLIKLIWIKCNVFYIQLLASSAEAKLSRPQLYNLFFFFSFCTNFLYNKNNAHIFRWVHMKVLSDISINYDTKYQTLFVILQFGKQFICMHSILKRKCSIYIKKNRWNFTMTSARKDLLRAVSMGLILQRIMNLFCGA